jgi:hypothetical protein
MGLIVVLGLWGCGGSMIIPEQEEETPTPTPAAPAAARPNQPPCIWHFKVDNRTGIPPVACRFDWLVSDNDRDPLKVTVDFGDGCKPYVGECHRDGEAHHTYEACGQHRVTLTVDDLHGHLVSRALEVEVLEAPGGDTDGGGDTGGGADTGEGGDTGGGADTGEGGDTGGGADTGEGGDTGGEPEPAPLLIEAVSVQPYLLDYDGGLVTITATVTGTDVQTVEAMITSPGGGETMIGLAAVGDGPYHGSWTAPTNMSLHDVVYELRIRARDGMGQETVSPAMAITVTAPAPPVIGTVTVEPNQLEFEGGVVGITAVVTGVDVRTVEAIITAPGGESRVGLAAAGSTPYGGRWSAPINVSTEGVVYQLMVRARDALGQETVSPPTAITVTPPGAAPEQPWVPGG